MNVTELQNAVTFNIAILNDPTPFRNADNSSNRTLASSIVVAKVDKENYTHSPLTIELYFQVQINPTATIPVNYLCTYFDTQASQWNDAGCTLPILNVMFNRYECKCNHLSSFALIWLPRPPPQPHNTTKIEYDAQDKASIAFQVISIACFIGVIGHGVVMQLMNPSAVIRPVLYVPLIACGVTMLLFIFYLALGFTVYGRMSQSNGNDTNSNGRMLFGDVSKIASSSVAFSLRLDTLSNTHVECIPAEHALMFIVFFFVIFMFGTKTSFGYYNYRHYVVLHPPPSRLNLIITTSIAFTIAILYMTIAAGLNSNPGNGISEVFAGKICWFSSQVIHYFITIPTVIFLAVNIIFFILVALRWKHYIRIAQYDKIRETRRRHCVIILLLSSIVQGLNWIFGLLMMIGDSTVVEVFGWLFVIMNGLEGVWTLILYIIARKEHADEDMRHKTLPCGPIEVDDNEIQLVDDDDQKNSRENLRLRNFISASPRHSFTDLFGLDNRANADG